MRPDRSFPLPPPSRAARDPSAPLRRFLWRRRWRRLLAALGWAPRRPTPTEQAIAHLDDRLLADIGLRRESGPQGDSYRSI